MNTLGPLGRSAAEDQLLELAAKTARKYWEVAGGWNQVQVAEYRLAMTYLALARPKDAAEHAALCRQICADNEAGPGDLFFAHEVEARVRHALGEAAAAGAARKLAAEALAELEGGLADYAAKTLGTLDELLG